MNPSSCKAKGRALQQRVRDKLLESAPQLEPDDIRSTSMGCRGTDIQLSPKARSVYPYDIECKSQEKLNIWDALKQAESNARDTAMVVFKRNRSEVYVALKFDDFLKLTQSNYLKVGVRETD